MDAGVVGNVQGPGLFRHPGRASGAVSDWIAYPVCRYRPDRGLVGIGGPIRLHTAAHRREVVQGVPVALECVTLPAGSLPRICSVMTN